MAKIFVSYSRADTKSVSRLITELEAVGHQVWVDRAEIRGGEIWRREIVNAVDTSNVMVLMLSNHSVKSDNVRRELDLAESGKLRILPVEIEPVTIPPEFRYQLVGVQRIDLYKDYDQGLNELLGELDRDQPLPIKEKFITKDGNNRPRLIWVMIGFFLVITVGFTIFFIFSLNIPKGAISTSTPAIEEAFIQTQIHNLTDTANATPVSSVLAAEPTNTTSPALVPTAMPSSAIALPLLVELPDGPTVTMIGTTGSKYQYTILSAQRKPLPPDRDLLHLRIRAWTDSGGGFNFWSDAFRLVAGDLRMAPVNYLNELVLRDTTVDGDVEFEIDDSLKDAVLVLKVGGLSFPGDTKELRLIFP